MLMVTIYTTKTCAFCHAAKEYLNSKHINFQEVKVDEVPNGVQELLDKSGQLGVPVIEVDKEVIVGFNREQLDNSLTQHKLIS